MTTTMSLFAVALVLSFMCVAHGQSRFRELLPLNFTAEDAPIITGNVQEAAQVTLETCLQNASVGALFDADSWENIDGTVQNCNWLELSEPGNPLTPGVNNMTTIYDASVPSSASYPDFDLERDSEQVNGPVYFDGHSDFINLGPSSNRCLGNLNACPNGVTYSLWLKVSNSRGKSTSELVYYLSSGVESENDIGISLASQARILTWAVQNVTDSAEQYYEFEVNDDEWYHLIATWKAPGTFHAYVNGVRIGTGDTTYTNRLLAAQSTDFCIGKKADLHMPSYSNAEFTLDGMHVYYQYLEDEDVTQLYTSGLFHNADFDLSRDAPTIPPLIAGREGLGEAFYFNGYTSYWNLGNLRSTCMGNLENCIDGITFSFWIKITNDRNKSASKTVYYISSGGHTRLSHGVALYSRDGYASWEFRAYKKIWSVNGKIPMNLGNWQHIIATWNSRYGLAVFVDGVRKSLSNDTANYTPPTDITINNFVIGGANNLPEVNAEFTLQDFKVFYRTFFYESSAKRLYESSDKYNADFDLANTSQFLPRRTIGFTGRQAFSFDGLSPPLNLGNQRQSCLGNLDLCPNGVTFMLWIKITNELGRDTSNPVYYISSGGQTSLSHGVALYSVNGRLRWWFRTLGGLVWKTDFEMDLGKWQHVIVTWKASQGMFIFLNGQSDNPASSVTTPTNLGGGNDYDDFVIGRPNNLEGPANNGEFVLEDFRVFYHYIEDHRVVSNLFLQRMSRPKADII